jgi:hypothetical protein
MRGQWARSPSCAATPATCATTSQRLECMASFDDLHSSPRRGGSTESTLHVPAVLSILLPPAGRTPWNACYRCFSAQSCWQSSCFCAPIAGCEHHSTPHLTPTSPFLSPLERRGDSTSALQLSRPDESNHGHVDFNHDRHLRRYCCRLAAGVRPPPQKVQRPQRARGQWRHQARPGHEIPPCVCDTRPAQGVLPQP